MRTRRLLRVPGFTRSHASGAVLGVLIAISMTFPALPIAQTPGDPVANCNPSFTACSIPEDVQLTFPRGFLAISGDVAVAPSLNSNLRAFSDVFRVQNNLFDTGLGTGLGNAAFLFSGH